MKKNNAFLRQFEPFICLTKLPQFLILHICWRNATVRCILLCSELYLSSIKSNRVAIDIPAAVCVALLINSRACGIQYVSLNCSSIDCSVRAQKVREIRRVIPGSKIIVRAWPKSAWNSQGRSWLKKYCWRSPICSLEPLDSKEPKTGLRIENELILMS